MSRNGSGTYSLPAGNPVVTGTTISSTWANNTLNDLASAMTQSIAADGQTPITGSQDMSGFKHTDVGDASAVDDYAVVAQVQNSAYNSGTVGGTADVLTLTVLITPAAYADGQIFYGKVPSSNTTTATLNVNGLGAKTIYFNDAVLAANTMVATLPYGWRYNLADDRFDLIPLSSTFVGPSSIGTSQIQNFAVTPIKLSAFGVIENSPAAMNVLVLAGSLVTSSGQAPVVLGQQTSAGISAPVGNPRIDRIVMDGFTGVISVVTGTPAGVPAAPAVPVGKYPLAQVLLQTSSTSITQSMITDERSPSRTPSVILNSQASNYTLLPADQSAVVSFTGASNSTFGFTAAATLGTQWSCWVSNSGTADVTLDPNGAETIDGLTSYIMYPGEMRLVMCNGTAFTTQVLRGFAKTFTSSGTFTKPPGYQAIDALGWGAGGSGGGNSSNNGSCGGGGGGGFVRLLLSTGSVSASEAITIGAGGTSVTNAVGNPGGTTSIGTRLVVYGGGGGGGVIGAAGGGGGGGGGVLSVGTVGGSGSAGVGGTGGAGGAVGGGTGGAGAASGGDGVIGGAPVTIEGGGGGGGGGSQSSPHVSGAGASAVYGGGGGGGGANSGASNTVGAGGTSLQGGAGGAGGKGVAATAGSAPSGGGGGTCNGANSGVGARGEVRIYGIV